MRDDRREYNRARIPAEEPGNITIVEPLTVLEISEGGALVELPAPLRVDSLHDFRMALGDTVVVTKVRIAHCRISRVQNEQVLYRAGVEFIDLPEHGRAAIVSHLERLKAARGPS